MVKQGPAGQTEEKKIKIISGRSRDEKLGKNIKVLASDTRRATVVMA